MRIGAALHCEIRPSEFSRKNYFYPDQAKDYQISQYDLPLNAGGWLELPDGFRVGVTRAHMEEDTGKLTHSGPAGGSTRPITRWSTTTVRASRWSRLSSEPDMRSSAQARAYVSELRGILVATGASDGRMEEGSMRVDANVSVRPVGAVAFGTRCEIKNLNSLRSLGRAIEYEAARQIALLEAGGVVARRPGTGTSRPVAPSRCGPRKRPTTTATSPSPTWCRWPPTRRGRPGGRRAWGRCRRTGGPTWSPLSAALRARPRSTRSTPWSTSGLDGLVVAGGRGRRAGRAGSGPGGQRGRGPGRRRPCDSTPARSPRCSPRRRSGQLSATQSKAVLPRSVERGGGDPAVLAKEMGFEALARTRWRRGRRGDRGHPDEWSRLSRATRRCSWGSSPVRSCRRRRASQRQRSGGRAPSARG